MKSFAVSNIAWSADEDGEACRLLQAAGIHYIEAAPLKLWPEGPPVHPDRIKAEKDKLGAFGLDISGFQALFFGKGHLNIFDPETKGLLLDYFAQIIRLCAGAGGRYVVFGAPSNRKIPDGTMPEQAFEIAAEFFRSAGYFAADCGISIGIEPLPSMFGCNFLTTVDEVVELVIAVSSPGIHLHLDTGELAANHEIIPDIIIRNSRFIRSLHISEPGLGDFSEPWPGHKEIATVLDEHCSRCIFSLEMKRPLSGLNGLRSAIEFVMNTYQ
jgi:sugar phosphate isomerase/epimerase